MSTILNTNFDNKTDHEINEMVATATGKQFDFIPDFCNAPEYAFPLIEDNKITLIAPSQCVDDWQARADMFNYKDVFYSPKPLRAAMIVFLLIKLK